MTDLVLPEAVASQLQGLPHPVNLCNSSGKTLGCFVPVVDPSMHEIIGPEPSDDELRRIEQSTEWYSTSEVLQHLGNLK